MRKFTKLMAALALLVFMAPSMVAWGQTRAEVVAYTLDGTITGSGSNYATENSITQNGISWKVTGNTTMSPWRIGGKSISNVDRPVYSTNSISDNITKIEVTHGTASGITVNSWTVIVATDASFTNVVSTLTPTFTASATTTINRPTGADWTNCYYKFIYNVTVTQTSNKFVQFVEADFYKQEGSGAVIATPTFDPAAGTYIGTQNVTISCETQGSTIYYTTDDSTPDNTSTPYTAAIPVSSTTTIKAIAYVGDDASSVATATYNIVNLEHAGTEADPYTVADARAAIDANVGVTGVYATGIVSEIVTAYNSNYGNITFDIVDELGNTATLRAYRCGGTEAANVAVNDVVVVSGNLTKYNSTYEFAEGCQLVSLTHPVVTTPVVTVTPATINAPAEGAEGTIAITYENIPDLISFDYYFCDANGDELEDAIDWIDAEINEEDGAYTVSYTINPNDGEARTANIKVYTTDVPGNVEVYDIVTVNQEEYVAPTYAELPFSFNGGRDDIETTDGLYQEGLGTDYNASTNPNTQLKFDGTGDWLLLQFEERPGTLTFDIKGNSFSGGTFTVQTSEDGTTYTDLQTYTSFGSDVESEEFTDLGENVRYIKWIYTNKATGNVGLGNITLAEYVEPVHEITAYPAVFNVDATAHQEEIECAGVNWQDFAGVQGVQFYDVEGNPVNANPAWISVNLQVELGYPYIITINANEGAARSAYFKFYTYDNNNQIYSNLVTVNQAAAPQQYLLTVEPFENLEIITFVNDEMVMEADGEIEVNDGDHIMLSIVADEGYVMETLMVNGVNHVNDIAADFTYEFDMPAEAVTISATAIEYVAPVGGDYVRITSLNELTDGSIVVIAARYDEEHTNGYYAMSNATSGKPTGVLFTSTTSGNNEILPVSIVDNEDNYYWTVNVTENGYTFTNAEGFMIGYGTGGTNFVTGGTNTEWTIESGTAGNSAMVAGYTGFVIKNFTTNSRAFAFNGSAFGPYAWTNNNAAGYNFYLDFFVQSETLPTETFTLDIAQYTPGQNNGWYLIASPVSVDIASNTMVSGTYDLYRYNPTAELEWENYEATENNQPLHSDFTTLEVGRGYLYANGNNNGIQLSFTGTPANNGEVTAAYTGWNLIGNPLSTAASVDKDYYRMNDTHTGIMTETGTGNVARMEGIFVNASAGETITFTPASKSSNRASVVMNLSQNRGDVIDRAIVRFGEGNQLPKFQLFENSTKLYITEDNQDYAIVRSEAEGEMPVSFKASENGTYTLTVNTENVEASYLHLIDNMTGKDVDLLSTPSYSFEAKTTDYANRFKLVFATGNNSNDDNFAFFSNGSFVINNEGNATLQVVDVTGRLISSETINGCANVNVDAAPGVYMLRLVNGENVKMQKVVVR